MAKNWAIVVGINQYEFLQPLKYAKRDAELMAQFLSTDAGFERVFLFTDDSLEISSKSTRPFRANLLRLFREIFEVPFMDDGDNFWFFFAGHGMRFADRDYLMPIDGDPHDIENTGIPINYLTERLRRCGADNVVMLLDACRNVGSRGGEGIGNQTAEEARQTGVISIFACSPNQFSHEVEALQQGAFTYALLKGLGIRGRCATVERLNQYLEYRVPEILRDCELNARQTPYTIAEPIERSHLILMPCYASLAEIAVLKNDAYQAENEQDWKIAERLWTRVNAAASGQDMDAVKALSRISQLKQAKHSVSAFSQNSADDYFFDPIGVVANVFACVFLLGLISGILQFVNGIWRSYQIGLSIEQVRILLTQKEWKEADRITGSIIRQTYRENQIEGGNFQDLDCQSLSSINKVWLDSSNGRFGLTSQKYAWQSASDTKSEGSKPEEKLIIFGELVGWRNKKENRWLRYDEYPFMLTPSTPKGSLPVSWGDLDKREWNIEALSQRLKECDIR